MMYVLEVFFLSFRCFEQVYFLTKKLENTALTKDKLETEKRKRASHERKKEVC